MLSATEKTRLDELAKLIKENKHKEADTEEYFVLTAKRDASAEVNKNLKSGVTKGIKVEVDDNPPPDEIYAAAKARWGSGVYIQAAEECSELSAAILQVFAGKKPMETMLEELADVEIMIGQIKTSLETEELEQIEAIKWQKLSKLSIRLGLKTGVTKKVEL